MYMILCRIITQVLQKRRRKEIWIARFNFHATISRYKYFLKINFSITRNKFFWCSASRIRKTEIIQLRTNWLEWKKLYTNTQNIYVLCKVKNIKIKNADQNWLKNIFFLQDCMKTNSKMFWFYFGEFSKLVSNINSIPKGVYIYITEEKHMDKACGGCE